MKEADVRFLEESFKRYYFERSDLIRAPERAREREFGYQKFNSGMTRHLSIKDDKQLRLMFMQNVPSDAYCSNSYYISPELPMKEKDWKEADLIFDIDAKDLDLPCRSNHAVSVCGGCGAVSDANGCKKCGSAKTEKKSLPCKNCMGSSKAEVTRLSEILTGDLGVPEQDIHVYFSGNEGFHVYVYGSQFQHTGAKARSDLVDYIMFKGAVPGTFGMGRTKADRSSFPGLDERGWRGRFARHVFGSKSKRSKVITELVAGGHSEFQKVIDDASEKIGVRIDPNVTMDIHRIFRMPGSLNSKSGLAKIRCKDLAKFDPYTDACLLSDEKVEVLADSPIQFSLKNKKFGPYGNERVSVPAFAAVYMICKKLATTA